MPIGGILFFAVFILLFGLSLLLVAYLLGPKAKKDKVKSEIYECGVVVEEKGDTKISIKFYLTAILFIVFDIEILFLFPWAISFRDFVGADMGLHVLIAMGIFIGLFIFGLIWEIKSKALEWE